ncbi:flap structure-specific endonuclease [Colletotrichum graminicola]|nr:flap structure-specific endonuclease [Colletotrichum graminicola]
MKKGSKRYFQREATTALLKGMLDHIYVPWHQAPGEAEAECALLQQKGLVDAVWSEDSDSFMFGCTLLIKDLRNGKNQKLKEETQSFDMKDIRKTGLFNKKSITLFGMLTGCDYDSAGLRGCGEAMARQLAKKGGLVEGFWRIQTEADAAGWRMLLEEEIEMITSGSNLSFNKQRSDIRSFPALQALRNCRNPVISDAATLDSLPFLQGEWYGTHTTENLKVTIPWMQAHFFSRKATIWWVEQFVPVTINQRFLKNDSKVRDLVAKVAQKRKDSPTTSAEFDPCQVFPGIEGAILVLEGVHLLNRWGELDRKLGGHPIKNVKFDLLDAILSQGMSESEFQLWLKKPRTSRPNKIHPVHPPTTSQLQRMPLDSGLGLHNVQVHTPMIDSRRIRTENRAKGHLLGLVGRSPEFSIETVGTPVISDYSRRKRLAKLDTMRDSVDTVTDDMPEKSSARIGNTRGLDDKDDEDDEIEEIRGIGSKKRKLAESLAEEIRNTVPGARGRQLLLDMELDSSQDSLLSVPIRTKRGVGSMPSMNSTRPGPSLSFGGGKGTANDPVEIL